MNFILNVLFTFLITFTLEKVVTDGLNFYELILLVLGVILFIVLLVVLIIFVIQKRPLKSLFIFFILPIIMIGYPSIQKISFDADVVTIEKTTGKLAANPNDTKAQEELNNALNNMKSENISNPQTLTIISKGFATIGDTVSALTYVEKAKIIDPKLGEASKLYKEFNKPDVRLERITNEIKNNPNDATLKYNLEKETESQLQSLIPTALTYRRLADTYASIGDTTKVLEFADSLLSLDPNSQTGKQLKSGYMKKPR